MNVVARMLDLARVGPGDYVIDLGCGDGRIVTEAAKRGARGLGIDLDGYLIELCRRRARDNGLEHLASFELKDRRACAADSGTETACRAQVSSHARLTSRPRESPPPPSLRSQIHPGADQR